MRRGSVYLIEREGLHAIPTQNMSEERWLSLRRRGIGGSDIAAVMGKSPWKTPLGVYCEKIGISPILPPSEAMEFGSMMEPTLRTWTDKLLNELYHVDVGCTFKVLSSPYLYQLRDLEIAIANVDGIILEVSTSGEELPWAGLELKTVDRWASKEWASGGVPEQYRLQCNWYQGITAIHRWVIGALIGKRFELRVLEFDQKLWNQQIDAAVSFWSRNVEQHVMPPSRAGDEKLLLDIFGEPGTDIIQAPDMATVLETYDGFNHLIRLNEQHRDELKVTILQRIGANRGLQAENWLAIWSRFEQERIDTKELKAKYPQIAAELIRKTAAGRLSIRGGKEEEDE